MRYQQHTAGNAFWFYGHFRTRPNASGSAGMAEVPPVRTGSLRLPRCVSQAGDLRPLAPDVSVSIPSNIAEGFHRWSNVDKARFMNMAEGVGLRVPLFTDTRQRTRLRATQESSPPCWKKWADSSARALTPFRHSGFWFLTSSFHIPKGYQGEPWLVSPVASASCPPRTDIHGEIALRCSAL
jgi:hypothetical protein